MFFSGSFFFSSFFSGSPAFSSAFCSSLTGFCSIMFSSLAGSSCFISFSFSSAFSSLMIILLSIFSSDLLSSLMIGSLSIMFRFILLISSLAAFNTAFLLFASVSISIADSKRVLPISDHGLHCGSFGLPVKFLTPSLLFAAIYSFAVLAISPTSLSSSA